jgi:hypothetical protein
MLQPERRQPELHVDVLLYPEGDGWAAHCLQLDLVECGASLEEVQEAILDVIRAHIEYALEHDNMEHLFHPAPPEVWKLFLGAELIGSKAVRIERDNAPPIPSVIVQEASLRANAA